MSTKPNYSDWLTKAQAAESIGVSTKTVEKMAEGKQIQQTRLRHLATLQETRHGSWMDVE